MFGFLRPFIVTYIVVFNIFRLKLGQSLFNTLPPQVPDNKIQYSKACLCSKKSEDGSHICKDVSEAAFPTVLKRNFVPMSLCDRQKRDVHYSDDLTEEDYQLFQQTSHLQPRIRRDVPNKRVSKKNATRFCAERVSETDIGKLCGKVGVNVQALVNTCSIDVVVSSRPCNVGVQCEVKFKRHSIKKMLRVILKGS